MAAELKVLEVEQSDITEPNIIDTAEGAEPLPEGEVIEEMAEEVVIKLLDAVNRFKAEIIAQTETGTTDEESVILHLPEDADETVAAEEKMAA